MRGPLVSERDELDRFYTPDALAMQLVELLNVKPGDTVLEPSVGGGAFARALKRQRVVGLDIDPDASGFVDCDARGVCDFAHYKPQIGQRPKWVIGNPPYSHALEHVERAIDITGQHVAFLLRLAFLESAKRYPFWRARGQMLRHVYVLAERPSFTGQGTDQYAYGWFHWDRRWQSASSISIISWKGK